VYWKLLLFSGLVYLPLAAGAFARRRSLLSDNSSRLIMAGTWLMIEPLVITFAFWSLDFSKLADLAAMPIIGTVWMLAMLAPAAAVASILKLRQPQRGNFLLASMFSNNGITLGAALCMVLFGEPGLQAAILFILGFTPLILIVGFGIGRHSARAAARISGEDPQAVPSLRLLQIVPYTALAIGIVLNLLGVNRPQFLGTVARTAVLADVVIYSFAIGTLFSFGSVRRFIRECLAVSLLKFIVGPAVGMLVFFAVTRFVELTPPLMEVTLIQCAMPVAITSVIVSRFCRLDSALAASLWVFTTLLVAPLVPILAWLTRQAG